MSKYKSGDKVVIEVKDVYLSACGIKCYGLNGIGDYGAERIDERTEPLSTYTEPLEAKIRRQAAEITRLLAENEYLKKIKTNDIEHLCDVCTKQSVIEEARAEGAKAAWELARKIVAFKEDGGYIEYYNYTQDVMKNYSYPEAAAKVSQWEKANEEIKVGDIYKNECGNCFVICDVNEEDNNAQILWSSSLSSRKTLDEITRYYTKTGRHIDMEGLLKQIGEE